MSKTISQRFNTRWGNLKDSSRKRYQSMWDKYGDKFKEDGVKYLDELNFKDTTKRYIITSIIYGFAKEDKDDKFLKPYEDKLHSLIKEIGERPSNQLEIDGRYEDLAVKKEPKTTKYKIISRLYLDQIPRRIADYTEMKVWKARGQPTNKKEHLDANWYIPSKGKFIFYRYKTARTFGRQEVDVSPELQKMLKKYTMHMKHGESLLNMRQSNFSTLIKRMFGYTVNEIRHMAIDKLHRDYPNMSNDEMERFSAQFGHSVGTHLKYRTKDLVKDPPEDYKLHDKKEEDAEQQEQL